MSSVNDIVYRGSAKNVMPCTADVRAMNAFVYSGHERHTCAEHIPYACVYCGHAMHAHE